MRSSRKVRPIRLPTNKGIPHISIPIQLPATITLDPHILPTQHKRSRLILVANRQRIIQPVLHVRTPEQRGTFLEGNVHVLQPGDVHHGVDVVGCVGREDDRAVGAAFAEGGEDGGSIVGGVGAAGRDDAGFPRGGGIAIDCLCEDGEKEDEAQQVVCEAGHRQEVVLDIGDSLKIFKMQSNA